MGILFVGGFAAFFSYRYRRILREAKGYERGLKMVPMLIHLPPSSSDIKGNGRDSRDVSDEAISKAQVLYDIIASTATKGFKSKFYGQRHIAFEIVASKGLVHFYVAVPVALTNVVEQAIVSAYPQAQLEEVSEHNIFSPVGKISGTIGGELVLKDNYIQPIATYEETKRDAMQSLLNSLSNLGNEDGAGIQILLRPAKDGWSKRGTDEAKRRREGDEAKKDWLGGIVSFIGAFNKPPESKEDRPKEQKQLTNLELAQIDAIESKTKHAGYETLVRVVASSNTAHRSQSILNNIVATFALFDAPGKNGFKYNEARDIESFATAYIMRFFPPELDSNVLNSVELATIFHFPDQASTPTSQLERQASKQVDGPRTMPSEGLLLGYNVFRGVKKEIRLSDNDRRRHLYIIGQTGTGKSTVLENLALQDMLAGKGFAFVDPHGDAVESLLSMVPKERTEDVIYFSPGEMDYPLGLNLFEFSLPEQKDFLIQEAINMLYKLYDPQRQGIIGPRYEHWFRNAALTLMSDPEGATFIDIPKVFTDNQYAKQKLKNVTDQTVLDFWNKEMASTSDYHKSEILGWFVSKFGAFLSNEMMRNIIGQTKSSFDLREVMDEGKILLVNLSKGRTGDLNSKLLGMIFVMKFQAAAMSRATIPENERRDFTLYVDEFQNFSTDSFSTILSEARKYRLNLVVANQFISQLSDDIRDAVFGNVGSVVSFRTGANDAEFLVKQFQPTFDDDDLVKLPNFQAVVRLMINNVPSQPFSMATLPPLGHSNAQLSGALKRLSSAKYGRPRKEVESSIFKRLETIEPPRPSFGTTQRPPAGARPAASGQSSNKTGSFLDDWLAKRSQQPTASSAPRAAQPTTPPAQSQPAQSQPAAQPTSSYKQTLDKDIDKLFKDDSKQQPKASPSPAPAQPATPQPPAPKPQPPTPKPKTDENTLSLPNQKAESAHHEEPTVTGEASDREDIDGISKLLKQDLQAKKSAKPTPEADSDEAMMSDSDDMYIDKDGNIHYRNSEQ